MNAQKAFTLIELLVVIAIIGVLAAAAIPQITGAICDANGATAEQAIASMKTAFTQCTVDKGTSNCTTADATSYNDYVSVGALSHLNINVVNGQLNNVSYNQIGCQYNAGGTTVTNKIRWESSTGNIVNVAP